MRKNYKAKYRTLGYKEILWHKGIWIIYPEETIGSGKFGVVKIGIHKESKKRVAVKIINKTTMSAKNIEILRYEIETLKMCQHPNILRLLDIFETKDNMYLMM